MALTLGAVLAGVLAGRAVLRPLRYRHLAMPRPHAIAVLATGFVLAVVADRLDGGTAAWTAAAGQALLVVGVLANLHLVGAGVLAVGLALNLLSMVVDRGVPVRPAALVEAGIIERTEVEGAAVSGPRHVEDGGDWLPWLGDAIPLEPLGTVVSFGDLIAVVGIGDVAFHAARPRRRRSREAGAADTVVIDLRGHVRSDEEFEAMLRHPTARPALTGG